MKKGISYIWGSQEEAAFQELKRCFCEAPVLAQWDPEKKIFLEADSSGYALGSALSQKDSQSRRRSVVFYLRRLTKYEYNYPIHDQEMLAIIDCL